MIEDWGRIRLNEGEVFKATMNNPALKSLAVQMNQQQLKAGVDSQGISLPSYSLKYAREKGKPTLPKTLHDTGDFYKGFYMEPNDNGIEMGSTDWKEDKLENGSKIVGGSVGKIHGLTQQNLDKFVSVASDIMVEEIKRRIMIT